MADAPESDLTAEQRFKQAAALLARGVRRYVTDLRRTAPLPASKTPEIPANCLEVSPNSRLSGSRRIGV
jgi:hypothetical protein